ncbi:phage terminase small subunit [Heyndrickxia coagulans]|uniref:phage terminase small subunit n=1 Tax=Heyndrickxia coagulans TaxID=1398 RepID=UPI0008F87617|nr:phage terminase small subunit [Heyndrickxia coagulans]APB37969.1 terminase [Heyndrickxia coagulans]WNE61789.1 terminase [Heyndrickxia coagulans]
MARPRDPRRDEAKDIWLKSGGNLKLVDLAKQLGVTSNTVRKWKATDKWDAELKGSASKSKRSAPKSSKGKRGAPKGNQNAKGNSGGAPVGNRNSVKTGEYESLMWDFLDDDEKALFPVIPTDTIFQLEMTIRELTIRQRRMMKRIKRIEDGLTEKQRTVLQELKDMKDIHVVEKNGVEVNVPVKTSALVVTKIEETEFKKIDDILSLEEALTRVTDKLLKALKQKNEIERDEIEKQLKLEKMRVEITKTKAEIKEITNESNPDDRTIIINNEDEMRRILNERNQNNRPD